MSSNKILIVSSHPDDEVLGCGGTIARLIKEGDEAYTMILGEGVTSRDDKRDRKKREKELKSLKEQIKKANEIIGVKEVFIFDLPDNRFDTIPFLDIVKVIEKIKIEVKPDIIFTHFSNDLNIDHRITYQAVLTACRPLEFETVREIYSFEVLSSTEWNFPSSFSPDVFFDISTTIDIKLKALASYKNELKSYPHPRSLDGVKICAKNWGIRVGLEYAEPFKCIRCIK